jgi:hypothetical protein
MTGFYYSPAGSDTEDNPALVFSVLEASPSISHTLQTVFNSVFSR